MIQACTRCGTQWDVGAQHHQWCARCHGALLAPTQPLPPVWIAPGPPHQIAPRPPQRVAAPPSGPHQRVAAPPSGPHRSISRRPPGYRWIAVRPGAAPPPRRRRRRLSPTPRYAVMPRWGLVDPALTSAEATAPPPARGPSPRALRATLIMMIAVFFMAAVLHVVRYILLIFNRRTLLNPLVAGAATWVSVVASVGAVIAVIGTAAVLTRWLIARRAAVFERHGHPDPRSVWALRAGCLIPFVNLAWAPVYVLELAAAEDQLSRLRRPVVVWWVIWVASAAVSVYASVTALPRDTQGIADNTMSFIIAYLVATAAVVTVAQVVSAFERKPVERPARRWLVVPIESGESTDRPAPADESAGESTAPVESERQDPAA